MSVATVYYRNRLTVTFPDGTNNSGSANGEITLKNSEGREGIFLISTLRCHLRMNALVVDGYMIYYIPFEKCESVAKHLADGPSCLNTNSLNPSRVCILAWFWLICYETQNKKGIIFYDRNIFKKNETTH